MNEPRFASYWHRLPLFVRSDIRSEAQREMLVSWFQRPCALHEAKRACVMRIRDAYREGSTVQTSTIYLRDHFDDIATALIARHFLLPV